MKHLVKIPYLFLLCLSLPFIACETAPKNTLTGQLIDKETHNPVSEGTIILCWINHLETATPIPKLSAKTDTNGQFILSDIPSGKYVIMYHPTTSPMPSQNNLANLMLPINLESLLKIFRYGTGNFAPDEKRNMATALKTIEHLEGGFTLQKGSGFEYDNKGHLIDGKGAIIFKKYELILNYENAKVTSVKIPAMGTTNITIEAWDL